MKRLLAVALAVIMCISLTAACNNDTVNTEGVGTGNALDSSENAGSAPSSGNSSNTPVSSGSNGSETSGGDAAAEAYAVREKPFNAQSNNPDWPYNVTEAPKPGANLADEVVFITFNTAPDSDSLFSPGSNMTSAIAYRMVYDTLVYRNKIGSDYDRLLATDWSTDDYKTWVFNLRENVYFSNGDLFTANDVVFTAKKAWDSPGSMAFNYWNRFEDVVALDDYTVQLVCKIVTVPLIFYMSNLGGGIVSEKACTADPEKGDKIGCGTFKWLEFSPNDSFYLERNDNYWGALAYTKRVKCLYIPEVATRSIMLQNGEVQYCVMLNGDDLAVFENNPKYKLYDRLDNTNISLTFNMTDPICSDLNFRMACASALDRESIALAYNGYYSLPKYSKTFWGPYQEYLNNDIPPVPEDIEKAKEYLAASAYKGETLELAATTTGHMKGAEAIAQCLAVIGIKTEVKLIEAAAVNEYFQWGNNKSQMSLQINAPGFNAAGIHNFLMPEGTANRASYNNQAVADLLNSALTETDMAQREQIYRKVQELVAEDYPYIGVYHLIGTGASLSGIFGGRVGVASDGATDLRYIFWDLDS